eukprot:98248_1
MGNTTNSKQKNETNNTDIQHLKMFSQLLDMGYPDTVASKAAKKFPLDTNQAINYANEMNNKHDSHNQKQEIKGLPINEGCVGLINLHNTNFLNAVIHCLSHTKNFREYFTSLQYKTDLNKKGTPTKGELSNKLAKLLIDIWSNKNQTISPEQFKKIITKYASHLFTNIDAAECLSYLLNTLHKELNTTKSKQLTEEIDEKEFMHLINNKSQIINDLFAYKSKLSTTCSGCKHTSVSYTTNRVLSLPISGHATTHLIIDCCHRNIKIEHEPNKPIRHIYKVNKYKKVSDLAKIIGDEYEVKSQFVLFFENWNMKVAREYSRDMLLGMLPNREAIACFLLKDWNTIYTPRQIKKRKLTLHLARFCHAQKLNDKQHWHLSGSPLFGMPFIMSFINEHTCEEIHKCVYERLYQWVGCETLKIPPPKLQKFRKINDNIQIKEAVLLVIGYIRENINSKQYIPEELMPIFCKFYEAEWIEIYNILPYKLRILPYRFHRIFANMTDDNLPIELEINDITFENLLKSKNIDKSRYSRERDMNILVEWSNESYDINKRILNKVIVDPKYSKWKKDKIAKETNGQLDTPITLYDCINEFVAEDVENDNTIWECLECKSIPKIITKKMSLVSLPEILIIKLDRFIDIHNSRHRAEKINTYIEYPIMQLDLSKYFDGNNGIESCVLYDLYAVIVHNGDWTIGHHVAYVRMELTNKWYYFNDAAVTVANKLDVVQTGSYILFYKKSDTKLPMDSNSANPHVCDDFSLL